MNTDATSSNSPVPPRAASNGKSYLRQGATTIFGLIVAFILNALSFIGPIVMIAWATYTLRGQEFPVPSAAVVLLMMIELWKPTASTQGGRKGFVTDMVTGHFELMVFAVTVTLLWDRHVWFGGQDNLEFFVNLFKANWAILFFAVSDDTFVLQTRYVLLSKQSAINMMADSGHHHSHDHGAVANS